MTRRSNALDEGELAIISKKTKTYVESFEDGINFFLKDCEIRNLRPHTLKFYRSEINTFLSYLNEQEIDVTALKPYIVTGEHIKENVILFLRSYHTFRHTLAKLCVQQGANIFRASNNTRAYKHGNR